MNRGLTLRRQVLAWVSIPLGILWAISAYMDYDIARRYVTVAYDRALLESALDIGRQVRVLIVNRQHVTPDVQRLIDLARSSGVRTVEVTETPPAGVAFQAWQVEQLRALAAALGVVAGSGLVFVVRPIFENAEGDISYSLSLVALAPLVALPALSGWRAAQAPVLDSARAFHAAWQSAVVAGLASGAIAWMQSPMRCRAMSVANFLA